MTKTIEFRAYSAKSKAVRALNAKGCEPSDDYTKQEAGKWGFYVDQDGKVLTLAQVTTALAKGAVRDDQPEVEAPAAPAPKAAPVPAPVAPVQEAPVVAPSLAFSQMVAQQVAPAAPVAAVPAAKKSASARPEANGVKRPGDNTLCGQIWKFLDDNSQPGMPCTVAKAKQEAEKQSWDSTTIVVQYYRWRKFNGISGRQAG